MLNKIKKIIYQNSYILKKNKMNTNNFFNINQNDGGGTLSVSYNNNIF